MFEWIGEPQAVVLYGDPRLTVKCRLAEVESQECSDTIAELVLTQARIQGFGLAAPQISRDLRVIVLRDDGIKGNVRVCINPEIIAQRGEQIVPERCLSIPGICVSIKRPLEVTMRYLSVDGHPVELDADGIGAAVVCHELDHLDGKLILDRVGKSRRQRLVRQHKKCRTDLFKKVMQAARR